MDFKIREFESVPKNDVLGAYDAFSQCEKIFSFYKSSNSAQQVNSREIEFAINSREEFRLSPLSVLHIDDLELIESLSTIRNDVIHIYPNATPSTLESTQKWLRDSVVNNEKRILFLVLDKNSKILGHLGLWIKQDGFIELDNVVKESTCEIPGLFSAAVTALESWLNEMTNIANLYLRVLETNIHAQEFYANLGYKELSRTPMKWSLGNQGNKELIEATEKDANEAWITMSKDIETGFLRDGIIPTAGPSISAFEVAFVNDAVKTGWNSNHSDYYNKFSTVFGEYVGAKYVIPTDSCTSALHLGLWALGIGPGDEVIVPDLTWVATANAVKYVGAKPIFADIDPTTWCIDPISVERLISARTKAIIPVHLYGYVADIDALAKIASKYNLRLLQDAAPGIGSSLHGKGVAEYGDFTAFSFQGAKLLVSGEGGALTTNNKELFDQAYKIADVGRKPGTFWIEEYGKKIKMSNLTAALALGQMQSVERQIQKKKRIQEWYLKGLEKLSDLSFQIEAENTRSIAWMTSINISKYGIDREIFRERLLDLKVDTRPVFPSISTYPIWDEAYEGNPVSNYVGANSINLPSGVRLNKSTVDYICQQIEYVLTKKI